MYALTLGDGGRILSATCSEYANPDSSLVQFLPEGDISDYCYVDGSYVHDPLAANEPVETPKDDTDAMLVDHEFRLIMLELGVTE